MAAVASATASLLLTAARTKLENYDRPPDLEIALLLHVGQKLKQQSLLGDRVGDIAEVWSARGRLLLLDQRSGVPHGSAK